MAETELRKKSMKADADVLKLVIDDFMLAEALHPDSIMELSDDQLKTSVDAAQRRGLKSLTPEIVKNLVEREYQNKKKNRAGLKAEFLVTEPWGFTDDTTGFDAGKPHNSHRDVASAEKMQLFKNTFIKLSLVEALGETDKRSQVEIELWSEAAIETLTNTLMTKTGDDNWAQSAADALTIVRALQGLAAPHLLVTDTSMAPAVAALHGGEHDQGVIGIIARAVKTSTRLGKLLESIGAHITVMIELCPDLSEHLSYFDELMEAPCDADPEELKAEILSAATKCRPMGDSSSERTQ